MTAQQYAQLIELAYQQYAALFSSNAPYSLQEAQWNVYQQLLEAYNESKKGH